MYTVVDTFHFTSVSIIDNTTSYLERVNCVIWIYHSELSLLSQSFFLTFFEPRLLADLVNEVRILVLGIITAQRTNGCHTVIVLGTFYRV